MSRNSRPVGCFPRPFSKARTFAEIMLDFPSDVRLMSVQTVAKPIRDRRREGARYMGKDSRKWRERRKAAKTSGTQAGELSRDDLETLIEEDPTLVPTGPSEFEVDDAVLDPQEINALLAGLAGLLEQTKR